MTIIWEDVPQDVKLRILDILVLLEAQSPHQFVH